MGVVMSLQAASVKAVTGWRHRLVVVSLLVLFAWQYLVVFVDGVG